MPKNYNNSICKKCPYYKFLHLECTRRPLSLENNESDTLLVWSSSILLVNEFAVRIYVSKQ